MKHLTLGGKPHFGVQTRPEKTENRYHRKDDRKVKVEAVQVLPETAAYIVHMTGGLQVKEYDVENDTEYVGVNVRVLGRNVRASQGDYVVKFGDSCFRTMSENEFNATYTKDS